MSETWIGYDGKNYSSKKEKIKADLAYVANLEKLGKKTFYGMDGNLYFDEKTYLLANQKYLEETKESSLKR